jgi:FkbM family methyltransferase
MRIFLDVGAHDGQTLEEVVRHDFGRIHAFEPMPAQYAALTGLYGDNGRVTLHNYGLAAATGWVHVYGNNAAMEASIFPGKADVDETVTARCQMVEASAFFRTLPAGAEVVVKLNCEGAEVPILYNLCDTNEIHRATNIMVDFDVRKIPGMEGEEGRVLARMAEVGFDRYVLCEDVMRGDTHQDRIRAWLDTLPATS